MNFAQQEQLLHGFPILDWLAGEGPFQTEDELRIGWRGHWRELVKYDGSRPAAWWKFEAGAERPDRWWREYAELERKGALHAGEAERFEKQHPEVTDTGPLNMDDLRHYGVTEAQCGQWCLLENIERNLFAANWHARHERPEMAAKYHALAARLQERQAKLGTGQATREINEMIN